MNKIDKALQKLSSKERSWVKTILEKIDRDETGNLDLKRLKGSTDIFRVRKGDIRIIYRKTDKAIYILAIERRNEGTYKSF